MLSGETAAGKFPVEAVRMMARVACAAEEVFPYDKWLARRSDLRTRTVTDAISEATAEMARDLHAAAIVTSTSSGFTARMVAKYRPSAPIIAVTDRPRTQRQLAVSWGVLPMLSERSCTTDDMFDTAVTVALKSGLVHQGDALIITAGLPVAVPGYTNLLRVHVVGTELARGQGIGRGQVAGRVRVIRGAQVPDRIEADEILVAERLNETFDSLMRAASGVVTVEGGLTSYAALKAVEYGLPAVVGVTQALQVLQEGMLVTLDAQHGIIYEGRTTAA
jgi:pyruvate kinase